MDGFNIEEDGCFYFESDHLALRGNKDYSEVLKTLVVLTSQRKQLLQDYKKVVELRKHVLENQEIVLKKLQNGDDLDMHLPNMVEITNIPKINFDNYNVKIPEVELNQIYTSNVTDLEEDIKIENELKKEQEKGRYENYNVWSSKEQKKLEELLLKYPPEAIERRRFQKIANELGTRSVAQVASRIQKYFLKLYKAGLPIPGRIPKSLEKHKKSFLHKHQRHNHYLWKPTTFFPNLDPPVTMDDTEITPGPSVSSLPVEGSLLRNYLLEGRDCGEERGLQLQLLKMVKEEKIKERENGGASSYRHFGFKCDYCGTEPIVGSRWTCRMCAHNSDASVDFCTDCVVTQMYTDTRHPLSHELHVCRGNEDYAEREEGLGTDEDSEFD